MNHSTIQAPDAELDLLLERVVDVPVELVWAAWTEPERLKKWFTPAPWTTVDCEIDLRPGGAFRTTMRSPEGEEFSGAGCYLEIVPNEKLVWTSALGPGYRPVNPMGTAANPILFTAAILLERQGGGTRYRALVIHGDPDARKKHEGMGFHHGWGAALDQLVEMVKKTQS